ncbi:MAG: hypothetical protein ACREEM_19985 [Blastocatellia bacterium]
MAVIFQDALDDGDVGFIAFDQQLGAASAHADAEQRFQVFDVLIVGAEQGFQPAFR